MMHYVAGNIFNVRFLSFLPFCFLLHPLVFSQSNPLELSEGYEAHRSVSKDKKVTYGFINYRGKVVIPHQFDTVYTPFRNGFAGVGRNKKAGAIDRKGKVIVPFEFKEIGFTTRNTIPVKSFEGLWGFYNEEGELIYAPAFQNYRYGGKNKIIVQKAGKWGMINHKGEVVFDFKYRWIDFLSEKNYRLIHEDQWSVRDPSNRILFSMELDSVRYIGNGYYKYGLIGRYGIIRSNGTVVTETDYDDIGTFRNGLIKVRKDNWGVIDKNNKVIIPFEYEEILLDSLFIRVKKRESRAKGEVKEKWGLYDYKGNLLIAPKYARMNEYSDGLIAVMREGGTWGYIDAKGNTEVIFRYVEAGNFKKGVARVKVPYLYLKEEHDAIIDKAGEYVVPPVDYDYYLNGIAWIGHDRKLNFIVPRNKYNTYEKVHQNFIRVSKQDKYGVINNYGFEIIPPVYDYVSVPSDKGIFVVEKDGKSGVVNGSGKFIFKLSSRFEKIFGFKEGFSKFLLKGKYGFIDPHGDVYISPQYTEAGEMSDSMVNVILRGKWAFVDYKENLKVQPYYDEVKPFKNDVALVKEHGRWNIVNKEGKEMHQASFDQIIETSRGNYLLKTGDKVGLADKRGREILAPKYEDIKEVGSGYVLAKKNGLWGALDMKENFVIPIEFDVLIYEKGANTFIAVKNGKREEVSVK